jgi:hypothetical protein
MCLHLGANWGPVDSLLKPLLCMAQASDADAQALVVEACEKVGMGAEQVHLLLAAKDGRPFGEAREIYDQGGRYISFIGVGLAKFHMEDDVPEGSDPEVVLQMAAAAKEVLLLAVA